MRLLLAFGNKARHGKDSAAHAIQNYFENESAAVYEDVRILKFADALYDVCRKEYGMVEKDAPLLQRIGAERRALDPQYWIKRLEFSIGNFSGIGLITDCRYLNEAAWVKSQGGFLINVTRLNEDGKPFVAPDRPADHPSEIELDGYPFDAFIRTYSGQEALAAEQAITIANYFYQITEPLNV